MNFEVAAELKVIEDALLSRWPESKIEPSLDRISALCDALGSPQLSYPTIHIAGTNGKTTTSRMIDSLLRELGYRTGRYTSPHLENFLERISIKGSPITPEFFISTYKDIALYLDLIDSRQPHMLSYFEVMTALAFVAFAEHPVDIAVIECGMGGEWDATNVLSSSVSVFTPIGLDHTEYLGETIEEIAATKSGIIRPESHVVIAAQPLEAAKVLLAKVAEKSAIPYREGIEFGVQRRELAIGGQQLALRGIYGEIDEVYLPLHGEHQAGNAAVALATVEAFAGQALDPELVRHAFAGVTSPGRMEIIHRDPTVIIDAAHNPHGMATLVRALDEEFDFQVTVGVFAAMADKDIEGSLRLLEPLFSKIIVTKSSSPRGMSVPSLTEIASHFFPSDRIASAPDVKTALAMAMEECTLFNQVSDGVGAVVVTGSVVAAGDARAILRKEN
jgi:dihydrofolate synthase / folylpolyglutamate synthase